MKFINGEGLVRMIHGIGLGLMLFFSFNLLRIEPSFGLAALFLIATYINRKLARHIEERRRLAIPTASRNMKPSELITEMGGLLTSGETGETSDSQTTENQACEAAAASRSLGGNAQQKRVRQAAKLVPKKFWRT